MKYTRGVFCNSVSCNIFKNIFEGYRWNILELYFVTAGKLVISRSTEILKTSQLCFPEISATNCPSAHCFPSGAREHSGWQFPSKTSHSRHHQRGADLYSLQLRKFKHSWAHYDWPYCIKRLAPHHQAQANMETVSTQEPPLRSPCCYCC